MADIGFGNDAVEDGRRRLRLGIGRFAVEQPVGVASLFVIVLLLLLAVFAKVVAPYDPFEVDFAVLLAPPSPQHWLGTDSFGRDIFSRLLYGARTALSIGILAALIGGVAGGLLGVFSAYYGGWFDLIVQRVIDVLLSFPIIVLALVVVAALGRAPLLGIDVNLVFAIAIPIVPKVARVVRSSALSVRQFAYVEAARCLGYSDMRIILVHMCPNIASPFLIMVTTFVGQAIMLESSLSFLGLGVSEPQPAWGLMLSGSAADLYREAPWVIVFPGLAIFIAVLAFSLLGDALSDWLYPKAASD